MTNTHFLYDDGIGKIELVQHMGEDITVVNSARVSFGVQKESLDSKDEKLIKYLVNHKHTSTLEHNIATFRIKVPLFVRSQHHRHRTWSYNEISRRYTDTNIEFYIPSAFRTQHKTNRQASNSNDLIGRALAMHQKYSKNIVKIRLVFLKSLSKKVYVENKLEEYCHNQCIQNIMQLLI